MLCEGYDPFLNELVISCLQYNQTVHSQHRGIPLLKIY